VEKNRAWCFVPVPMQTCPALTVFPQSCKKRKVISGVFETNELVWLTIRFAASFKSYLGSTIVGDCPPSYYLKIEGIVQNMIYERTSRVTGVRCFAAAVATILPTVPLPVKTTK
jgi:hypothetical protein